jgi:hypothetical protein
MFSQPFRCGAELPKGRRCDALASVTDAEYIHREELIEGQFELLLDEVRYTLECPKCGPWQRVEVVHMNRSTAADD